MGAVTVPTCRASEQVSDHLPYALVPWYGLDTNWRLDFERAARRTHRGRVSARVLGRQLIYEHEGLEVVGSDYQFPITIIFEADQKVMHLGLHPMDYPSIYVVPEEGAPQGSPHRMPDGGLCLFFPKDPPQNRWQAENGLDVLLGLIANHLFAEAYWRASGGEWVIGEAPHGVPRERKGRGRK